MDSFYCGKCLKYLSKEDTTRNASSLLICKICSTPVNVIGEREDEKEDVSNMKLWIFSSETPFEIIVYAEDKEKAKKLIRKNINEELKTFASDLFYEMEENLQPLTNMEDILTDEWLDAIPYSSISTNKTVTYLLREGQKNP